MSGWKGMRKLGAMVAGAACTAESSNSKPVSTSKRSDDEDEESDDARVPLSLIALLPVPVSAVATLLSEASEPLALSLVIDSVSPDALSADAMESEELDCDTMAPEALVSVPVELKLEAVRAVREREERPAEGVLDSSAELS